MLTHLPRPALTDVTGTAASFMDVVDLSTDPHGSLMDELVSKGGTIYGPPLPRQVTATSLIGLSGGLGDAEAIGAKVRIDGSWFEQLVLPGSFFRSHPGDIEVCINDHFPRWEPATSATHTTSNCSHYFSPVPLPGDWFGSTNTVTQPTRVTPALPPLMPYVPYPKPALI